MKIEKQPDGRWVCFLTKEEGENVLAYLRERTSPAVEGAAYMQLVARPYAHLSSYLDVVVPP